MEAIILAGGFGTRLQSVVADVPKSMAPIGGKPFLEILLNTLAAKGFTKIVLSLGYMSDKITSHFGTHFSGMQLDYVIDPRQLGTGGATQNALSHCEEDHVFIFNGDTFLDLEVSQVEEKWLSHHRPIMVVRHVPETSRYGRVKVDGERVILFSEKGESGPGLINAGCYLFPKKLLDNHARGESFSLENEYLATAVQACRFDVFETEGHFLDIGIPADYERAQIELCKWIK